MTFQRGFQLIMHTKTPLFHSTMHRLLSIWKCAYAKTYGLLNVPNSILISSIGYIPFESSINYTLANFRFHSIPSSNFFRKRKKNVAALATFFLLLLPLSLCVILPAAYTSLLINRQMISTYFSFKSQSLLLKIQFCCLRRWEWDINVNFTMS